MIIISHPNLPRVRRNFSIGCLLFAWLCANGALWNVVQVVGWLKMFHDYSERMSPAKAMEITFDGSAPCSLCHISQDAEDTARRQLPHDTEVGSGMEKLLLASEDVVPIVVTAPDFAWPRVRDEIGLSRTNLVSVPPPRC